MHVFSRVLIALCLSLSTFEGFSQVEFYPDTTTRPSRSTRFRIGVINSKPYIVPRTGPVIPIVTEQSIFAVGGGSIQPTTISAVRAITSNNPSEVVFVNDGGREGLFVWDRADVTSTDDDGAILVTASGKRFVRVGIENGLNAAWYNAKGDNVNDDTAELQAFFNAVLKANNPAVYAAASPRKRTNKGFIGHGIYKVSDQLLLAGSGYIELEEAESYGGARIVQITAGKHLLRIMEDTDGTSSGIHIRGGILKGGSATSAADVALIYCGNGSTDGNNNSTTIEHVWFQTPETYDIHWKQGDDVWVVDCRFDVSPFYAIKLGSATTQVHNFKITSNTFYDIRAGAIDFVNVDKGQIKDNRVYKATVRIPHFLNVQGASTFTNMQIEGNMTDGVNRFFTTNTAVANVKIVNNTILGALGRSIEIGGGGSVEGYSIQNNTFSGDYSGTLNVGVVVRDAPIFCYGTGLTNSIITGNTFTNTGSVAGTTPLLLTDSRTKGNTLTDNSFKGFARRYNDVANLLDNGRVELDVQADFGAVADGVTNASPAIQEAINAAYVRQAPVVVPAGTYKIMATLTKPQSFSGLTMRGVGKVLFEHSTLSGQAPCIKVIGGSGAICKDVIDNITFSGSSADDVAIELAGQCGQKIVRCTFTNNLVGVRFHNEGVVGTFTEYCLIEDCDFQSTTSYCVQYKRTGADASFHGSGLGKGNLINTVAGVVIVDEGCLPYNCPLNGQIWVKAPNCFLVKNDNASAANQPTFHGSLTFEKYGTGNSISLGTGSRRTYFMGPVIDFGDGVTTGLMVKCRSAKQQNLGSVIAHGIEWNGIFQMPTGSTTLTAAPTEFGVFLADVQLVGPNYDYRFTLQIQTQGYGGPGFYTVLTNQMAFNVAGYGAPTFAVNANGHLTITNPNFPASGVTAYVSLNQVGVFNPGNIPAKTF